MADPKHPLAASVLRARILTKSSSFRGRVRELTPGGRLVVDTRASLEPRVTARLTLSVDGQPRTLEGEIERVERERFVAALRMDAEGRDVVARLLARATDGETLEEAYIEVGDLPPMEVVPRADAAELGRRWDDLRHRLEDDAAHAAFIGACTRAGRLDYAVARYRELDAEAPGDPRIRRYLDQVAAIASVQVAPRDLEAGWSGSKRLRTLLWLFLGAAALLAALAAILGGMR